MQNEHNVWEEFIGIIVKGWLWLGVSLAVVAKISVDVLNKRNLNWKQWFAVAVLSLFGGYMAGVICVTNGWYVQALWVGPAGTFFSERLVMWISLHFNELMRFILFRKGGKDESGNT